MSGLLCSSSDILAGEQTSTATSLGIPWSSVMEESTKEAAWQHFVTLFNRTGTHSLNNRDGNSGCMDECSLSWMQQQIGL